MTEKHAPRRRWLIRAVKVLLLIAVVAALIPFCAGLAPVTPAP